MENQLIQIDTKIIESLVLNGDLSKLNAAQKVAYYNTFCERIGLDPATQPFKILNLKGKEVLYCDRSGTQQLNKLHNVSHKIVARETVNGCYVVTAQASANNRQTESIGAVPIDNIKGEALCNAMMKAETKAKRRATLDLLGLGILDESEVSSTPEAKTVDINHTVVDEPTTGEKVASMLKKPELAKDTETVEVPTETMDAINAASTTADLAKIYNELKDLQASKQFVDALAKRRMQIKSQKTAA